MLLRICPCAFASPRLPPPPSCTLMLRAWHASCGVYAQCLALVEASEQQRLDSTRLRAELDEVRARLTQEQAKARADTEKARASGMGALAKCIRAILQLVCQSGEYVASYRARKVTVPCIGVGVTQERYDTRLKTVRRDQNGRNWNVLATLSASGTSLDGR